MMRAGSEVERPIALIEDRIVQEIEKRAGE